MSVLPHRAPYEDVDVADGDDDAPAARLSPRQEADIQRQRQLKQLEEDEQKDPSDHTSSSSRTVPIFTLTSDQRTHNLLASQHVCTADHLASLFSLTPTSHPSSTCHWCAHSPLHASARSTFPSRRYVTFAAPMVRYSKLPFRLLARHYGVDVCYTPMIIAAGFNRSPAARDIEFQTNALDQPLIVQFGADNAADVATAAALACGYVQGVDINCGCPQRWAVQSGYGAALIQKPQLVADMVRAIRGVCTLPVSIKIRVQDDLRRTVELVQQAERAGVNFITVHGRTPQQRRQPVNVEAIALVKSAAAVPIVANGDVFSPASLAAVHAATRVDGLMAARGLLANPALFTQPALPLPAVAHYLRLAEAYGGRYSLHHHHLQFMLSGRGGLSRAERMEFSGLRSLAGCRDWMAERGWLNGADGAEGAGGAEERGDTAPCSLADTS